MTTAADIVKGMKEGLDQIQKPMLERQGRFQRQMNNLAALNTLKKITFVAGLVIFALSPSILTLCLAGAFCFAGREMHVVSGNLREMLFEHAYDDDKIQKLFSDEEEFAQEAAKNTLIALPFIPLIIAN